VKEKSEKGGDVGKTGPEFKKMPIKEWERFGGLVSTPKRYDNGTEQHRIQRANPGKQKWNKLARLIFQEKKGDSSRATVRNGVTGSGKIQRLGGAL